MNKIKHGKRGLMKKASLSFPENMTTDELDDAIRSLISDGELKMADAWEIRERAIAAMGKSERSLKRKSDSPCIINRIKKGCISIEELASDIEELISRLDGCADGMRNSAHFEMKEVVHGYRKKYGIKTKTYVQCNEMCGGRMSIEKYHGNKESSPLEKEPRWIRDLCNTIKRRR